MGSEFKDETVFSIEALKYEVALCMKKHLQTIKTKDDDRLQEYVLEDEANADEHGDQEKRRIAATKIQAWFRGTSLRLLIKAREPGNIMYLFWIEDKSVFLIALLNILLRPVSRDLFKTQIFSYYSPRHWCLTHPLNILSSVTLHP